MRSALDSTYVLEHSSSSGHVLGCEFNVLPWVRRSRSKENFLLEKGEEAYEDNTEKNFPPLPSFSPPFFFSLWFEGKDDLSSIGKTDKWSFPSNPRSFPFSNRRIRNHFLTTCLTRRGVLEGQTSSLSSGLEGKDEEGFAHSSSFSSSVEISRPEEGRKELKKRERRRGGGKGGKGSLEGKVNKHSFVLEN